MERDTRTYDPTVSPTTKLSRKSSVSRETSMILPPSKKPTIQEPPPTLKEGELKKNLTDKYEDIKDDTIKSFLAQLEVCNA